MVGTSTPDSSRPGSPWFLPGQRVAGRIGHADLRERRVAPWSGGMDPSAGVVRVGDTVRRPARRSSPATRALLLHLEAVGFEGAPRFLGVDEQGRDVLTFVEGDVPLPPYPPWALTDEALESLGRLLRRFHDATATFDQTSAAGWPDEWSDREGGPVVCHNDLFPENVVFRDGRVRRLHRLRGGGAGPAAVGPRHRVRGVGTDPCAWRAAAPSRPARRRTPRRSARPRLRPRAGAGGGARRRDRPGARRSRSPMSARRRRPGASPGRATGRRPTARRGRPLTTRGCATTGGAGPGGQRAVIGGSYRRRRPLGVDRGGAAGAGATGGRGRAGSPGRRPAPSDARAGQWGRRPRAADGLGRNDRPPRLPASSQAIGPMTQNTTIRATQASLGRPWTSSSRVCTRSTRA